MIQVNNRIFFALMALIVISSWPARAQQQVDEKVFLGAFNNGFAKMRVGQEILYLDEQGAVFNVLNPNGAYWEYPEWQAVYHKEMETLVDQPKRLPRQVVIVVKNGQQGVMAPGSVMLLPTEYDAITFDHAYFWTLEKGGLKSMYLADGTVLPFFEDIGYLDGIHFDVKKDGAWHIYSVTEGKIVTQQPYEGFDYCGGCGSASNYVYAKKGGKWGILSWDERVLIPFEYDHEHGYMRNDNWVRSFSKQGQALVVHIPTQKEYAIDKWEDSLLSGNLVLKQQDTFGLINGDGEQLLPFDFDEIKEPNANHFQGYYGPYVIAVKDNQQGVFLPWENTWVLPMGWEDIKVYDDYFVAKRAGTTYLFKAGQETPLLETPHGEITHINDFFYSSGSKGIAIFEVKARAFRGLYFAENQVLVEPQFYELSMEHHDYFEGGFAVVGDRQGLKTLFDTKGRELLPFAVEDFQVWEVGQEMLLSYQSSGKWGLYDLKQGQKHIPPSYDPYFTELYLGDRSFIRATIENGGYRDLYVLYDGQGNRVQDIEFTGIDAVDEGYSLLSRAVDLSFDAYATTSVSYYLLDHRTLKVSPLDYAFVGVSGAEGLLVVSEDRVLGRLYDIASQQELDTQYWIYQFSGEYLDDFDSLPLGEAIWELSPFQYGAFQLRYQDQYRYIDRDEKSLLSIPDAEIWLIEEDLFYIGVENPRDYSIKTYLAHADGKSVFPEEYQVIADLNPYAIQLFSDVVLLHKLQGENPVYGLGNVHTGEILIEPQYEEIRMEQEEYFLPIASVIVEEDGYQSRKYRYGLIDQKGNILFEPQFNRIYITDQGSLFPLLVQVGDTWKYVLEDGSFLPVEGRAVL